MGYTENRNRIDDTYRGIFKSLDQPSIRKVCKTMETGGKFVSFSFYCWYYVLD